jgi:hypothetical protein
MLGIISSFSKRDQGSIGSRQENERGGCTQWQCFQDVLDRCVIKVIKRVEDKERVAVQIRMQYRVNGSGVARCVSQGYVGEEAKCTSLVEVKL